MSLTAFGDVSFSSSKTRVSSGRRETWMGDRFDQIRRGGKVDKVRMGGWLEEYSEGDVRER